jgi:mutator protein MutT
MNKRTISVGVIAYDGDKVLLVKHTKSARLPTGSYGFPAGRVEDGENPIDAAVREFHEETGYTTSRDFLYPLAKKESTLQMENGTEDFVFTPFVCSKYTGEKKDCEDNIPEWVKLSHLDDLLLVSDDVKTLARQYKDFI